MSKKEALLGRLESLDRAVFNLCVQRRWIEMEEVAEEAEEIRKELERDAMNDWYAEDPDAIPTE